MRHKAQVLILTLWGMLNGCKGNSELAGFYEIGKVEFQTTIIGNTISGVYKGHEFSEYYNPNNEVRGFLGGLPYSGSWKLEGNNCVMLDYTDRTEMCWVLFRNPDTGFYMYAWQQNDGGYINAHQVTIHNGNQIQ